MAKLDLTHLCCTSGLVTIMLAVAPLPQAAFAQTATTAAATSTSTTGTRNPVDPGVRGGDPGAGDALANLTATERAFFDVAKDVFQEVDGVADGLGPRFNLDGCTGCHSQPAIGGTSPAVNPQATLLDDPQNAKGNVLPAFITKTGPVREARFVRNPDGSPDGGVHGLFVITGRGDAGTCNIRQPNFAAELASNNVVFRIPTPTFGLGLVESVPDGTLEAALAANGRLKRSLGISGRFNRNGNDGTIARFGWKAQNKSLLLFAGEAYNVEIGVTNDLFPNERETDPSCQLNSHPESPTPLVPEATSASPAADFQADIALFAAFMRLLAPPTPASAAAATAEATQSSTSNITTASMLSAAAASPASSSTTAASSTAATSATRGRQVFSNVGCQGCHAVSLTTGKAQVAALNNVSFEPFSDFAVHDMGDRLADGVSQGGAGGREFRTAPLWGVGQRIFFLHDGRTSDLNEAIQQHASRGSEANTVVHNYNLLSLDDKQALVNFLRSL
jgi:CxxC motif-containing protein (DUF1111 family)